MSLRLRATVVVDPPDGIMLDLVMQKLDALRRGHDALVQIEYSGSELMENVKEG
jgi:hypothetical protein